MTDRHTVCEQLDAVICEFEQRRKDEPRAFYSRLGHSDENGPAYTAVTELAAALRGYTDRLEALR